MRLDGVEQRAFVAGMLRVAGVRESRQVSAHPSQIGELVVYSCDRTPGTLLRRGAAGSWRDPQGKKVLDLFECEPESLSPLDEFHPADRLRRVLPVAGGGSWRGRKQPAAFVVAQGVQSYACLTCNLSNGEHRRLCVHLRKLDPGPESRVKSWVLVLG